MTARSSDALSHVNFQARQNAVLAEIQCAGIPALAPSSDPRAPQRTHRFRSYLHGGYEAASRNEAGRSASFVHYLPKSFRIKV